MFYGPAGMLPGDALTPGFAAPLVVTALYVTMLSEHVGWRGWIAAIADLLGVLNGTPL